MILAAVLAPLALLAAAEPAGDPVRFSLAGRPAAAEASPLAAILTWLAEQAPDYPADLAPEVAARVADEIRQRRPGEVERLGGALPVAEFESLIWQVAAARLKGPAHAALREALAFRRIEAVLRRAGGAAPAGRAAGVLFRLRNESEASQRRLLEGRMEDDELLRIATDDDPARRAEVRPAAARPKVLTAAEIVGEYARRNQAGAAAARLRAYAVEARVHNPDGSVQELRLFKLRPQQFRVHLRPAGGEAAVLGFDGRRYWRQAGAKVTTLEPAALGPMRHLAEFLDPLLEADRHQFERLEDGMAGGRPCHRVRVRRTDGSEYVAVIDAENFRQVGRENPDGSRTTYDEFREVAGLTLAFREDLVLADRGTVTMEIREFRANPGLVADFFAAPTAGQLDLGPLEQVIAAQP